MNENNRLDLILPMGILDGIKCKNDDYITSTSIVMYVNKIVKTKNTHINIVRIFQCIRRII